MNTILKQTLSMLLFVGLAVTSVPIFGKNTMRERSNNLDEIKKSYWCQVAGNTALGTGLIAAGSLVIKIALEKAVPNAPDSYSITGGFGGMIILFGGALLMVTAGDVFSKISNKLNNLMLRKYCKNSYIAKNNK